MHGKCFNVYPEQLDINMKTAEEFLNELESIDAFEAELDKLIEKYSHLPVEDIIDSLEYCANHLRTKAN